MQSALSQRSLDEGASPSFCAGRQLGEVEQATFHRISWLVENLCKQ